MTTQSLTQLKFWNKKSITSDFMITVPNSLDNYFSSQLSRRTSQLPLNLNINNINSNNSNTINYQSLQCILSKKLRGMKLCANSNKILKQNIIFMDKKYIQSFTITLQQLFNYYLKYKQVQLTIALNNDKISNIIIRPFLRIFSAVCNKQYTVTNSQRFIQKQLNKIFDEVLRQNKLLDQNYQYQSQQIQEYYNQVKKRNKNGRIIEQANKILDQLQTNGIKVQQKQQQDKYKIRDFRHTTKSIKFEGQSRKNTIIQTKCYNQNDKQLSNARREQKKRVRIKITKQAEEKTSRIGQDDEMNLCYELGLLITDTDRILKPIQDDILSNQIL